MTTTVEEDLDLVQATAEAPVVVGAVSVPLSLWQEIQFHIEQLSFIERGKYSASHETDWATADGEYAIDTAMHHVRGLAKYIANDDARLTADAPSTLGAGGSLEPHTTLEAPVGFTPGPWQIFDKRDLCDEIWIGVDLPEVGEITHASVRLGCDDAAEFGNIEANAKLIAMAPDLLAGRNRLRDALERVLWCAKKGSYGHIETIAREALGAKQP